MSTSDTDFQSEMEPMIDAKQAACALRLPLYWFADQKLRAKYRIPHYLLGSLVRFRMNELGIWVASSKAAPSAGAKVRTAKGDSHDGL